MALPDGGAVTGGATGNGGWISWEQLSNIAAVFSVFVVGGLIPLSIYLHKKYKQMKTLNTKKDNENITEIATEVSKKIDDKLNEHIDKQEKANEKNVKSLQNLCGKMDDQNKQNKAIISITQTLTKDFHAHKEDQNRVNAKVDFMEKIVQDNIKLSSSPRRSRDNSPAPDSKDPHTDEAD